MLLMSRCMPDCRGGSRRQLALEECKLFGESNMANIDCGLSVVNCWKFGGLPGSIPTAPINLTPFIFNVFRTPNFPTYQERIKPCRDLRAWNFVRLPRVDRASTNEIALELLVKTPVRRILRCVVPRVPRNAKDAIRADAKIVRKDRQRQIRRPRSPVSHFHPRG